MKESKRPASIKPAKKIVVLRRGKFSEITKGNIEMVGDKSIPELGEVLAIGEGPKPVKMKIGDVIAYRRFGESKVYFKGEEILFVSFQDVLAVFKRK